ncbi:mediator of RNA polymerase II transcription subunit 13 isoform X1 [Vanessa cardui]|uniref:mediator of RNA polymerase II transcription subunit 13 isoform X1 n=1 Tax=Vanessa cardui TaxID=171605 RepID=UPI001F13F036|nr:mediator of RNA polymerase II transcription subunit 13 isoform X1 [Vanessa cardui]
MTHQNHQTNGASLEDCHTNFFALTELYGIKWRKLVWGETSGGAEGEEGAAPLADPVISSYARCLAGDILCVWRRVPAPQPLDIDIGMAAPPPLSLRASKELWIFWYGEEPDLNGLVAPELIASQGDQGSWESGLSYECRSLLFKALHNLIERCLLSRDFVRLGKWFVQPYDGDEEDVGKSPWHLSFSFAFFLHGESTVCASVDVRQHPPVRTLTAKRLARLHSRGDNKVILAPFGLEGRVTGREWGDGDAATARLLDAWRHLYPLEQGCGAVEVECGGVRMRYPVPYVLVTEMEAPRDAPPTAARLATRALAALAAPRPHQTAELCYAELSGDANDDFVDPTRKTPCTCAKASGCGAGCAGGGGACSPGSCGAASPAGAPSPHHAHAALSTLTTLAAHQVNVPTTLHTPAPTPDPLAPPTPAPPSAPPHKNYAQGESPGGGGAASAGSPGGASAPAELLRRPALPAPEKRLDPLEDEHSLHMLYDYTTVHAWLEHPVKRFKSAEGTFSEELALGVAAGDLYAGHDHTRLPATPLRDHALHAHIKSEKQDHEDAKEYKNLFTSDGLCPTLKDLEQIFDNSDDAASGDETVRLLQVQTPPDSNKSMEETRCLSGRCVRAEELSKMFPTPPSMEAHAQPSPGFSPPDDAQQTHAHAHSHVHGHRAHGSPPPDPIEDWSYVFKPPTICKYVGSSKYAPLTTLPSQMLPPVALPPHAVYRPRWQRAKQDSERDEHAQPHRTESSNTNSGSNTTSSNTSTSGVKRSISASNERVTSGATPATETRASPRRPGAPSSAAPCAISTAPASPRAAAPACPLLLNVLLADTVLNVFRDHNFDSCTLCVCNAGARMVGNIRGADAGTYLPGGDWGGSVDDEPSRCSCGFSAIVNRRLAHRAGLFYEDEMEITGIAEEPGGRSGRGTLGDVAGVVVAQCAAPAGGAASALARAARRASAHSPDHLRLNLLEYSDGGAAAARALRAAAGGAGASLPAPTPATAATAGAGAAVHRWPFIGARAPRSSRDVVRLMRRLRPLLQDAIQKRCCGARMWDGVTGPLTWRQFHRLAGRGNEDLCEPQPVPPLLVGHDRDWISLSPYALRHWERLSLEPYSYARDVAYVVLAADGDYLSEPIKTFFRELSAAYESCRLGRHQPIARIARDGIVKTAPSDGERDSNYEEWTGELPPGRLGEYMKAYAETLRSNLVPQLAALNVDRTLFETNNSGSMRPPTAPEMPGTPGGCSGAGATAGEHEAESSGLPSSAAWEEDEAGAPALVLYVVEPPAAHAHRPRALTALLRLAAQAHHHLHHHNPLIKIISLEGVCETWGALGSTDVGGIGGGAGGGAEVRALAFSVFSSARRLLSHSPAGKSLTGFGTAANANLFLSSKDEKNRAPYKLFSPAWVLAPPRALKEVAETWGTTCGEQSAVLFLAYCLSHDQRWLLAAATDARGELLDTAAINIHVPARSRRKRGGPARRLGLTKLMDFTLGVMSQSVQPWRLVVGRVGRIGHGELKGWSWLLSRPNLNRASNMLREMCGSCSLLYPTGAPCILSACLVSTEPDSCLRLMADRFTPDERFSQASIQSHLHTPRDVTATHILVFPTSATTQSNQMPFEPPNANGEENDMLLGLVDMVDEDMGEENMTDLLISDMFMWPAGSPRASPRRHDDEASREGSPARHAHLNATGAYPRDDEHQPEQVGTVLQQPLALGYLVSTAPLGAMPGWWWASCWHLRDACPAFLKNALHLQCSVAPHDDYTSLTQRRDHNTHPLDSTTTTDVLRYVLEGYNALSWLALDGTTHDRLSCLPLHVQVLMQLYHTAAAIG